MAQAIAHAMAQWCHERLAAECSHHAIEVGSQETNSQWTWGWQLLYQMLCTYAIHHYNVIQLNHSKVSFLYA